MKNDGVGGGVYSPTDVTSHEREVCARYVSVQVSSLLTQQAKPGNGVPGLHLKKTLVYVD